MPGTSSLDQFKVMSAVERCRTAALGGHVAACEDCGHSHIAYNSCRNRHCPKCQGAAARDWLADREAELLPVGYFHLVFTLPSEIADIAYQNKRVIYGLLFKASAEAMLTIAADPKHLGAKIGFTAVLHSWGSAMTHHPHTHMIVPGGGISPDGKAWIACRPGVRRLTRPHRGHGPPHSCPCACSPRLFRRVFLEKLVAAHEAGDLQFFNDHAALAHGAAFKRYLQPLRKAEWVVYAKKPFAGPEAVLAYLSRYTHRVAISNSRLVSADRRGVTFRWKNYRLKGAARYSTMTLPTHEFIRRFLMHVLPKGFHRIRPLRLSRQRQSRHQPRPGPRVARRAAPRTCAREHRKSRTCPHSLAPDAAAPWSSSKPSSRDKHRQITGNAHRPTAPVTSHDGAHGHCQNAILPRLAAAQRSATAPRASKPPITS